jgi:hypothetical protein
MSASIRDGDYKSTAWKSKNNMVAPRLIIVINL